MERFWQRVEKGEPDECWPWTGPVLRKGYGAGYAKLPGQPRGKTQSAHRIAYTFAVGPIPAGKMVLHSCDNPPCCNPAHLRTGTHRENMADMVARGRGLPIAQYLGVKRSKLSEDDVRAIRQRAADGDSYGDLGRAFSVTPANIAAVVKRRSWKHIA